jgi:hypothetical protein
MVKRRGGSQPPGFVWENKLTTKNPKDTKKNKKSMCCEPFGCREN